MQDAARERDKEYQKLKVGVTSTFGAEQKGLSGILQSQHDKIKRKALLAPNAPGGAAANHSSDDPHSNKLRAFANPVDLGAVVGGMEASGVFRSTCSSRVCVLTGSLVLRSSARPS
jgi:hypothetical protein